VADRADGDPAFQPGTRRVRSLYHDLLSFHGPQGWWPADTCFEVMVGAVLTQNTSWSNVERAIAALKAAGALEARRMRALAESDLAQLIRPAGYFNVKARRLRALLDMLAEQGGEIALGRLSTRELRDRLLSVKGVGPETADDILLYAFDRPVFVIDAYTRRLFRRLGWLAQDEGYETLRAGVEQALGEDVATMQELHALIVANAKASCGARPRCRGCPLDAACASSRQEA